jgi:3-hydroxyacyl-[acyl-carrier-protein] dehydratase
MHFTLIDRVVECTPERTVTLKNVSQAEEYLQDHFPTFPVLPGVMMLECMAQAARHHLEQSEAATEVPWVLGRVRALKYGRFVKPGATLKIVVEPATSKDPLMRDFKAQVLLLEPGVPDEPPVAASGRITMRAVRIQPRNPA